MAEVRNYLGTIEDLHKQIIEMLSDLPSDGLNWVPIETMDLQVSNSIAVLAAHIAGAEHHWIGEVVGRLPQTRDRSAEFMVKVKKPSVLIDHLNHVLEQTRSILSGVSQEDIEGQRQAKDRIVSVRWAILHVIDHTALHLGHIQITYQLWAKGDTKSSPFWFSRVPRP